LLLGLSVLLAVPAVVAGRRRRSQVSALLVVSTAGFAGMAATVLILAVTQSALGVLHHLLGALLAANMTGLALAAATSAGRARILPWVAIGLSLVVPGLLPLLARVSMQVPPAAMIAALLVASLAAGGAVGIAFRAALVSGAAPAAIYAVDLLGAALAAPVIAAVALPGFGLDAACALVALLSISTAFAVATNRPR